MKVRRDNVEYGLYDDGNLTGGIMVQKLNGQTLTTINGTRIKAGGSATIEAEVTATELAKFGLVDSNGNFTAGLVVNLINNSSDTQAVISASKIVFEGNTTLAGALNMVSGQLKVEKQAVFSDNVWLSGNKNLTLQGSGALVFSGTQQADSITIDNSTLKNALKSADVLNSVVHFKTYSNTDALTVSKSGNVLTFTDADGHTLSFSKATTVGGSWGGSTTRDQYTVNVTQNNETVGSKTIGFQQGSEVQMSVQSNLNDTDYPLDVSSGTIIRVPIKVVRQNDITGNLDTPAWRDRIPVNISSVLESKSVSANGTYTPASGYAGFSQVVVNVPSGELSNVRTRFNASSGQYYFEAFDQVSGNPIPNTSNTYQLGVSGTKVQIQKTDGTKYDNTPEYTIPAPTVSDWSLGTFTSPYTYKPTVKVNGTTYTSGSLNATGAYDAGWTAGQSTSSSGQIELYRTPTGDIAYGTTYTIKAKAYSSRSATAKTDISGATISITTPSFPTVSDWSLGSYTSPYSYKASVKVGGTTYTSGSLNAVEAYAKGWTSCYNGVQLDSTTATTLSYGQSITVYAQAYSTKDATARTNKQSRTITAPADNYGSGYVSGWNDYYSQNWYLPTEDPPSGKTAGKFYIPNTRTSASGSAGYQEWTRGTTAWNNMKSSQYVSGWNDYFNQNWYLPTDTPPTGLTAGKFYVPNTRTSSSGSAGYQEWERGTIAWDSMKSSQYNSGYNSAHLSSSWNAEGTRLSISKTTSGSINSMSFEIGAKATITYNSSTHKYTATAQAKVDGTIRGTSDSATGGTDAYDAGYVGGWNDYFDQNWYLPTDTPPGELASGKFYVPDKRTTASGSAGYQQWERATIAWNAMKASQYNSGYSTGEVDLFNATYLDTDTAAIWSKNPDGSITMTIPLYIKATGKSGWYRDVSDAWSQVPTAIWNAGYDDNHSGAFIMGGDNDAEGKATFYARDYTISAGGSINVWPGFLKKGKTSGSKNVNDYIYGPKYIFRAQGGTKYTVYKGYNTDDTVY